MKHRFFKTGSSGVLIGIMSLSEIAWIVHVHKIQGVIFYFAQISINDHQCGFGFAKSLKRPFARNGISSCS